MAIYRVCFSSMTATYGPQFIEADDEYEAKRKFAGKAFSRGEMALISARQVSVEEMKTALEARHDH